MILKEDTPYPVPTGRPLSLHPSPLSEPVFALASASPPSSPTERIPHYRPPSFPPQARLGTPDPAPWRGGAPPRYKFRKRPFRWIPLIVVIACSGFLLGSCVNFLVESIIKIATTHIRGIIFKQFKCIMVPGDVLIAASSLSLVFIPLQFALPRPSPVKQPFRLASFRWRLLVVTRVGIPVLSIVIHLFGTIWFTVMAVRNNGIADARRDTQPQTAFLIGNGGVPPLIQFPNDGDFWVPRFYSDTNVKIVVWAAFASTLAILVFLSTLIPHTLPHAVFTSSKPPARVADAERKLERWWKTSIMGREAESASDEEEGEILVPRLSPDAGWGETDAEEAESAGGDGRRRRTAFWRSRSGGGDRSASSGSTPASRPRVARERPSSVQPTDAGPSIREHRLPWRRAGSSPASAGS